MEAGSSQDVDRLSRARAVALECLRRRAGGEAFDQAEVIASHPDLMPELEQELRKLSVIRRGVARVAERASSALGETNLAPSSSTVESEADLLIEGYEIRGEIHRGGQGVVYRARQRSTGRDVALKVLRVGWTDAATERARFEREVQILAGLRHPNIVTIHDSGTSAGLSYFVMDYVEGRPLDAAVRPGLDDPRELLALVAQVAETVDYAHQRGVLHRDLKPSNVMIDARGQVQLLDFGLAKPIRFGPAADADLSLSEPGQVIGTVAYMSPEQARGRVDEVSVRSDVYALGVLAYQLLCGRLPCDATGSLRDALNRIAEQEPRPPSAWRRGLSADVDAIVLKALEKHPAARYATAGELAADIRRWLADLPVAARRAGWMSRAARLVRRHRAVSTVTAIAAAAVLVVSTVSIVRVVVERDRAMRAAEDARRAAEHAGRVKTFLAQTLGYVDPDVAGGPSASFVDQLDHAAGRVADAFVGFPLDEAEVRHTLGHYYRQWSAYEKAEAQLRAALAIRTRELGAPDLATADTAHELAAVLHARAQFDEAAELYAAALNTRRAALGERHADVAAAMNDLAWLFKEQGHYAEAEELYGRALRLRRELLGERHPLVGDTLNDLAHLYYKRGDLDDARRLFLEALDIRRAASGPQHSVVKLAATMNSLGGVLTKLGEPDQAEPLLRAALDMCRTRLGEQHTQTIVCMNELGLLLRERADYDGAEELLRRTLELRRMVEGPRHRLVAVSLVNLALVRAARGSLDEAQSHLEEALGILRIDAKLGDHQDVAATLTHLARVLRQSGQLEQAERACREGLEMRERLFADDPQNASIGDSELLLGRILLGLGAVEEARQRAERAVAIFAEKLSPTHARYADALALRGRCLLAADDDAGAETDLRAALEVLQHRRPLPDPQTAEVVRALIELYDRRGDAESAERYRILLAESP